MEEASSIFREKSLEKVRGPEKIDDYIRVANPAMWMILLAILFLLGGIFAWALFGEVEILVPGEDGVYHTQMAAPSSFLLNNDTYEQ